MLLKEVNLQPLFHGSFMEDLSKASSEFNVLLSSGQFQSSLSVAFQTVMTTALLKHLSLALVAQHNPIFPLTLYPSHSLSPSLDQPPLSCY